MYVMPVVDSVDKMFVRQVQEVFHVTPPQGVMWAVVITFPDIVEALTKEDEKSIKAPQRAQPSAHQIASRAVVTSADPRRAGPRSRVPDPRDPRATRGDPRDPRAKPNTSNAMSPDLADALAALENQT